MKKIYEIKGEQSNRLRNGIKLEKELIWLMSPLFSMNLNYYILH